MSSFITLIAECGFLIGGMLCITGGIGLLRFPDFFSRVHAAGVTETLAAPLLMLAIVLHQGEVNQDSFKLLLITFFILATNPTASHAMTKAALHGGKHPLLGAELSAKQRAADKAPDSGGELSKH